MYASHIQILDPRFQALVLSNTHLETLWQEGRWTEGPVYFGDGRFLLFSDIPNNQMLRYDETDGSVSLFRQPSHHANGSTRDREGRLVTCEHSGRRVTRTEFDGAITILADAFEGKRLNSPNDVVVDREGAIWFTDPSYGIDSDYEGDQAPWEQSGCHVYRIDPLSGAVAKMADDFEQPNGLAFSADGSTLLIVDSGGSHRPDGPGHIRRFKLRDGGLSGGAVFADCTAGRFDGLRLDEAGNVWAAAEDGVHCLAPDGQLLGKILVPECCSNLCFGGPKRNRLYICATRGLYAAYVNARGLPYPFAS
ncbi:MAG: SMP-30/gluconolactonase/LRE family protein [Pseudomonadota bacterium]